MVIVKWTKRADIKYSKILQYLIAEFGYFTAEKFYNKTFNIIELISNFQEIGILEEKDRKIYSFLIVEQVCVFYRFDNQFLYILNFFATRQNPKKRLNFE